MNCTRCGEKLNDDEIINPYLDWNCDDGVLCDECYHEHYEFTCCLCQEYGDVADQHNMIVVFEGDYGVPLGVYATDGCYYTQGLIGSSWLHPRSLRRLDEVPAKADGDGYPCGHLCEHCQRKFIVHREWGNLERYSNIERNKHAPTGKI
jgi:hypothetical protein